MFSIIVLAVGKIKDKNYKNLAEEYLKRLSPYAKIKVEELPAESFNGEAEKIKAKKVEGERILKFLDKHESAEKFLLDEHGQELTSVDWARRLEKNNNPMVIVIGGALGHSEEVLDKIKNKLSLSKMTFPHEMARVILLEQIYRAATIIRGKEYHY